MVKVRIFRLHQADFMQSKENVVIIILYSLYEVN
jgi:hypothetical protein